MNDTDKDEIRFTIDDYDKVINSEHKGYYMALKRLRYTEDLLVVTLHIGGCEYIGTLRLYKDEEGKVIE